MTDRQPDASPPVPRIVAADAPHTPPGIPPYFVARAPLSEVKDVLAARTGAGLAPLMLHGPAGAGKTSLAAALAEDTAVREAYPDGVLWAALGPHADVQAVQAAWGTALGLDLTVLPAAAERAASLRERLRDARALLVLDDVHDAEDLKALNVGGPHCARLITTSDDEVTYAVKARRWLIDGLADGEALTLLEAWAGMLPGVYVSPVREIAQRLACQPLALAVVGGQARQGITWLRLLEEMENGQGPLAALDLQNPATHHAALGLVLRVALSRLGKQPAERALQLAALQPGLSAPFSADAAAACWQVAADTAETTLRVLADAALVRLLPSDLYAMHPALHDHLTTFAKPIELAAARTRAHQHYIRLAEEAPLASPVITGQMAQLAAAFGATLRAASARASTVAPALTAAPLLQQYEALGLWERYAEIAGQLAESAQLAGNRFDEYAMLGDYGYAQGVLGRHTAARETFTRMLSISRELGDPLGEAQALNNLGAIGQREGEPEAALEHYRQGLAIYQALGEPEAAADTLMNIAGVQYEQAAWDEALGSFQRALDVFTALGDRAGQAQTWLDIGAVYERMDREDEAEQAYQRSLAATTNLGDEAGQALALNNLGIIAFNRGQIEQAVANFKRSLALKEQLGDRAGQAATLNNLALLYEKDDKPLLALEHYQRSYDIFSALGDSRSSLVLRNIDALSA